MYRPLLLFLLAYVLMPAYAAPPDAGAQQQKFCLVLWQKNGAVAKYQLNTHPRIKYRDGDFWIISDEVEIAYPVGDVRKFTVSLENISPDENPTEEQDAWLVLWQKNGEIATYQVNTHPRIKYRDGNFWIISDEVEIAYPVADVRKFTICTDAEDMEDTIEQLPQEEEPGHTFSFDKARPGSIVSIYDVNGRQLGTYTVRPDGRFQYSLDNRPAGVYLIKTESTTIKIIKK